MTASSYDAIPYDKLPCTASHPDHLAALATLFGAHPAPVDRCRVLEIGCARAGNLVPMAFGLPGSRFAGIDLSARQIADGKLLAEALGLKNIELQQQDILDLPDRAGEFDYIIAHGVYSWVPDAVQEKILRICGESLSPNGIAFISYNTYPGWHFRGMLRDMMRYHALRFPEPRQQIAEARSLLDFLARSIPKENPYGSILRTELQVLQGQSESYLFHEHLEENNAPTYFHEFVERAARHDLQYLAEAEFGTMLVDSLPAEAAGALRQISDDVVRTEQYMDFLRNRGFRQTLLCRTAVALDRSALPQRISMLEVASSRSPDRPRGHRRPFVAAAFSCLAEAWPQSLGFDELVEAAHRGSTSGEGVVQEDGAVDALRAQLLAGYAAGQVKLRTRKAPLVANVTERPTASALARHQAAAGDPVTTQTHESGNPDDIMREMLMLLDGTKDRHAVVDHLAGLVASGRLRVDSGRTPEEARGRLYQLVDERLLRFARTGILVA